MCEAALDYGFRIIPAPYEKAQASEYASGRLIRAAGIQSENVVLDVPVCVYACMYVCMYGSFMLVALSLMIALYNICVLHHTIHNGTVMGMSQPSWSRLNFARGAPRRRLTMDVPGRRPTAVGRLPRDARSSMASCDASSRASEGTRVSTPICRRRMQSSADVAMALASARRMRRQRLKRASWRLRQVHGARRQCQEAPSGRLQQRGGSQHQASRTPAGASGEEPCRDASDEAAPGGAAAC